MSERVNSIRWKCEATASVIFTPCEMYSHFTKASAKKTEHLN